jgi:hypothetical protein
MIKPYHGGRAGDEAATALRYWVLQTAVYGAMSGMEFRYDVVTNDRGLVVSVVISFAVYEDRRASAHCFAWKASERGRSRWAWSDSAKFREGGD